jgi:GABA(A) receptor-associated protein
MEFINQFKQTEELLRIELFRKIKSKHTDRIPIIVDRGDKSLSLMTKHKFMVPYRNTFRLGEFIHSIRQYIPNITSADALYVFVGADNNLLPNTRDIKQVYDEYKDRDGFLYMTIFKENTLGTTNNSSLLTIIMKYLYQ